MQYTGDSEKSDNSTVQTLKRKHSAEDDEGFLKPCSDKCCRYEKGESRIADQLSQLINIVSRDLFITHSHVKSLTEQLTTARSEIATLRKRERLFSILCKKKQNLLCNECKGINRCLTDFYK